RYRDALAPLQAFRARFPAHSIAGNNLRMLEARLFDKLGEYRAALELTAPIAEVHPGARLYQRLAQAGLGERAGLVEFLRGTGKG
ncbi:hypothetical protein ABTM15_20120, partial [Acinetobacter baumannii]